MPHAILRDCVPFKDAQAVLTSRLGEFTEQELEAALAIIDPKHVDVLRSFIWSETTNGDTKT